MDGGPEKTRATFRAHCESKAKLRHMCSTDWAASPHSHLLHITQICTLMPERWKWRAQYLLWDSDALFVTLPEHPFFCPYHAKLWPAAGSEEPPTP